MNWKQVSVIIILILFIMIGIFFFKFNNPFGSIREDLVSYLEDQYNMEFTVNEIKFWPLNRIVLKDLKINKGDELLILAPEMELNYQFTRVIADPGNWTGSITSIYLNNPEIRLNKLSAAGEDKVDIWSLVDSITNGFKGSQLTVNKGLLVYEGQQFKNLNLRLDIKDKENLNLEMLTDTSLSNFEIKGQKVENLNLEGITLDFSLNGRYWQGKVSISPLNLNQLSALLPLAYSGIDISDLSGQGNLIISFNGREKNLTDYNGKLTVNKGTIFLDWPGYINTGKIINTTGEIYYQSKNRELLLKNFEFNYAGNPFQFEGVFKPVEEGPAELSGYLTSDRFNLNQPGINLAVLNELDLSGRAQFELFLNGEITDPGLTLDFYLPQGQVRGELISYLKTHIRYRKGFFYVDSLNLQLNQDNQILVNGVYNTRDGDYSFTGSGQGLEFNLFKRYISPQYINDKTGNMFASLDGKFNCDLVANGNGLNWEDLTLVGDIEVENPEIGYNKFKVISTRFWLARQKLVFNQGLINMEQGIIEFSGEVDIEERDLNISLAGDGVDLAQVNRYFDTDLISGVASFSGMLTRSLADPLLVQDLSVPEGSVDSPAGNITTYNFKNLLARLSIDKNEANLTRIEALSNGATIKGSAGINYASNQQTLAADLLVEKVDYGFLEDIINSSLPLVGRIDSANIKLSGTPEQPVVTGKITSKNTSLTFNQRNIALDEVELKFSSGEGNELDINKLTLRKEAAEAVLSGNIQNKNRLDLDFIINNLQLNELGLKQSLSGLMDITGRISGDISSPYIGGKMSVRDLLYENRKLGKFQGDFHYRNDLLELTEGTWQLNNYSYQISGDIYNLAENPGLEINASTEKGSVGDLLAIAGIKSPVKMDYYLAGKARISGPLANLRTELDFNATSPDISGGKINLNGEITDNVDIAISGQNVQIKEDFTVKGLKLNVETGLDFEGMISGPRKNIGFSLKTVTSNAVINDVKINHLEGEVKLDSNNQLQVNQQLILEGDSCLNINGSISLGQNREMDLNLDAEGFPLQLIASSVFPGFSMSGYTEGKVRVRGLLSDLTAQGDLFLEARDITLGLEHKINVLKGNLIFAGKRLNLSHLTGTYNNNPIELNGSISPFNPGNFWNITFAGRNLLFTGGTIKGKCDPDLTINGQFYTPEIRGEILVHDMEIRVPFSFKAPQANSKFKPLYNIVIKPGENVYLRNENIDVMVQVGSLTLSNPEGKYELEGQVSSRNGSFDFYNNKFILETSSAVFERFKNNIPDVHVTAHTYIHGIRVTINLDGPANRMITSFNSQPSLPEKEILDLLASRGGLGGIISGEGDGVTDFLKNEITRFFQQTLELKVVKNLEERFKDIFSLDRMEIDIYDLGWNRDITVYLGKQLSDKLYLEYSRTFSLDSSHDEEDPLKQLSFSYYLTDKTHLEGNLLGNDEIRFFIETSIDF